MKALATGVIAIIVGAWVVAIAILSVQNVFIQDAAGESVLVTLRFLGLSSVPLPLGIVLALCAAIGMIGTALVLPLLRSPRRPKRPLE